MNLVELYKTYCVKIIEKDHPREYYDEHQEVIDQMTPFLLFETMNQLKSMYTKEELLDQVGKFINAFSKGLLQYPLGPTPKGSLLYTLRAENYILQDEINVLKTLMKRQDFVADEQEYTRVLDRFHLYDSHLKGIEALIFPLISRKNRTLQGIVLLAMYHDRLRKKREEILAQFKEKKLDKKWCNKEFAELFFFYQGVITKQDLILFPIMNELLLDELEELHEVYSSKYPFTM